VASGVITLGIRWKTVIGVTTRPIYSREKISLIHIIKGQPISAFWRSVKYPVLAANKTTIP
jgi:hypothetical protein